MAGKREEAYLEKIIKEHEKAEAPAATESQAIGDLLLSISENKSFYVDQWNTPKHVESADISATTIVGNVFENSIFSVVGDLLPEALGYFFGGVKGPRTKSENPYYANAINSIITKHPEWFVEKEEQKNGGKKPPAEGYVPKEHERLGGVTPKETENIYENMRKMNRQMMSISDVTVVNSIRTDKLEETVYKTKKPEKYGMQTGY